MYLGACLIPIGFPTPGEQKQLFIAYAEAIISEQVLLRETFANVFPNSLPDTFANVGLR
jgi:hypothetical protein